jgi:hypothetical protein
LRSSTGMAAVGNSGGTGNTGWVAK